MRTFIIIVSVIWIGFFIWAKMDYKKRRKESNQKKYKPAFRTEEDVDKYAKPMKDDHQSQIEFDDAE